MCQTDKSVVVWDVVEAKQRRDVKGMGQCTQALFCNEDKWIACATEKKIIIQDIETGQCAVLNPLNAG